MLPLGNAGVEGTQSKEEFGWTVLGRVVNLDEQAFAIGEVIAHINPRRLSENAGLTRPVSPP